jgi:hypothetical protein
MDNLGVDFCFCIARRLLIKASIRFLKSRIPQLFQLRSSNFLFLTLNRHPERPPNLIGHNVRMTESFFNAAISTSARGEISLHLQISPDIHRDEMTRKLKSVIGSVVEGLNSEL